MPRTILVVDDEKNIRRTLAMVLESEGFLVEEAPTAEEAMTRLADGGIDALILDVKLPGISGLDALDRLTNDSTPVIMISGHASIEDAVRATKAGAFDFIEKPLDRDRVLVSVRNAFEHGRLTREVRQLRAAEDERFEMLGSAPLMQTLRQQIAKVAPTRGRVLVTGESGTGKELIARALHRGSLVTRGPFVKLNCAAIPPELIESELFGHERGAFTGAVGKKRGLFEQADGGTLFLDEIGDMALPAQAKVLRVLQTGEQQRVGGERTMRVDPRIIAATNRDLGRDVAEGKFREDLFFRLNVIPLHAPPLRERAEDIADLAEAFALQCCRANGFAPKTIEPDAMALIVAYRWPGNVRELKNVMERAVILSDDRINVTDLPDALQSPAEARDYKASPMAAAAAGGSVTGEGGRELTLREYRDEMERDFIRRRLEQYNWNISRTAEVLGVERTNLHKKLRALGIQRVDE
jgi:two-component system, NtrC family, nitrogen regulation response regulator NtrX